MVGGAVLRALIMALAFCLCASAVYVINDMVDLEAHRQDPVKRMRPLASGALPLWVALVCAPGLLAAGFWVAFRISMGAAVALAIYFVITLAYSYLLKPIMLLDVICLALRLAHLGGERRYKYRVLPGARRFPCFCSSA